MLPATPPRWGAPAAICIAGKKVSASIAARPGGACGIIGLDDEDGPGWGRFCTAVSRPDRPCMPVAPGKPAAGLKAGPARRAVVPGPRRASPLSLGLAPGPSARIRNTLRFSLPSCNRAPDPDKTCRLQVLCRPDRHPRAQPTGRGGGA
ncbi:hypothetical protein BRI6_1462 [plant metagenome]|uniref:Uncharacterized protein n=1 Tax=plant metagenome TaxID=1297885 RepID=A0A484YPS5_9ZZZZ